MMGYEMIICVIKYNVVIMFDNCSIQYKAIVTAPSLLSDAGVRTGPRPGEGGLPSPVATHGPTSHCLRHFQQFLVSILIDHCTLAHGGAKYPRGGRESSENKLQS